MVDDATCYTAMNGETFAEEQICAGGDPGEHSLQASSSSEYLQARMGVKVTLVDLSCLIMMADGN